MRVACLLSSLLAAAASAASVKNAASHSGHRNKTPFDLLRQIHYQSPKKQSLRPAPLASDAESVVSVGPTACTADCGSTLSFLNPAAEQYQVGNSIPGIPFKTRTSWAGELPLAGSGKDSYFFWLWRYEGNGATEPSDKLVVWLQGGPGCSSLFGMLQEVGPITYVDVGSTPMPNNFCWTLAADMLFPEQPLGVGFSQGNPTEKDEVDVARAFMAFLDSFYHTFDGMRAKKLLIAAESYGGVYGPYIANALIQAGSKYNFQGLLIVDGAISDYVAQSYLPVYQFVVDNAETLKFNSSDIAQIRQAAESCGYVDYMDNNLHFPPKGKLPPLNETGCYTADEYANIAASKRSTFDIYDVADTDSGSNVLGNPDGPPQSDTPTFFDQRALRRYIHAPTKKWNVCNDVVFPFGDGSLPPATNGVLQSVIKNSPSQRTVIMHGLRDGLIFSNGTTLALQNLTWAGVQGFSESPYATPLLDTIGQDAGFYTYERGLLYALVNNAGHMVPVGASAAFALLQHLLGQRTL